MAPDHRGLPEYVVALVNTEVVRGPRLLLHVGSFREHRFNCARVEGGEGRDRSVEVEDRCLLVRLGPAAQAASFSD